MTNDDQAPWMELAAINRKHYPRLEARFGACPVCQLTATALSVWPPITWAVCQCCSTRWQAGTNLLEIAPDQFEDVMDLAGVPLVERENVRDDVLFHVIAELAEFTDLGACAPLQGDRMATRSTASSAVLETSSFGIDPQTLQGPREVRVLQDSSVLERIGLADAVIRDLRQHPPSRRHPLTGAIILEGLGNWDRVRAAVVDPDRGTTIEQVCGRVENGGGGGLFRVTELIFRAQERRIVLERELATLDRLARAFSAPASIATGGAL